MADLEGYCHTVDIIFFIDVLVLDLIIAPDILNPGIEISLFLVVMVFEPGTIDTGCIKIDFTGSRSIFYAAYRVAAVIVTGHHAYMEAVISFFHWATS